MNSSNQNYKFAFAGLTILFFMWGFITVMNDVLINTFGELFDISPSELSYIQLSFFGTFFLVSLIYFLISSYSGNDPINKIGYKNGMSLGLVICGLGCSAAYFASLNASYNQFLFSLFVLSVGVTLLQICANPYATILGSSATASSRLNLAQGFNSLGTTIGPIVGNILIYSTFSNGSRSIESVGLTYLLYGAIFVMLALAVRLSNFPAFLNREKIEKGFSVLKNRNLRFGVIAIFFYVGSEVSVGSWIGHFAKDKDIMGLDMEAANYFLAFFWGGLMIGRLMASISLNEKLSETKKIVSMALTSMSVFFVIWLVNGLKVSVISGSTVIAFTPLSLQELYVYMIFLVINFIAFLLGKGNAAKMIVIFCCINAVLLLFGMFAAGQLAFWAILGTGLFFSIGWSNIFSLSIKGLGSRTSQGSALLVMAIVGGAVLPFIQSRIIEASSVQTSFIIPLLGMVYLIFFGLNGHKQNKPSATALDQ